MSSERLTPSGKPRHINSELPAGSPMYFYCERCGEESDVLPENYILRKPKKLCEACSPKPFDGEVEVVSKVTYGEESNALRVEKQILVFRDGLLMEVQDAATIDWYDPHPNWT